MVLFKYCENELIDWLTDRRACLSTGFSQCVEQYFINRIRNPLEISRCEWFGIAALIFSSDGHISRHSYARVCAHCACMLTMCWSFVSLFFECLSCFHVIIESNHLLHIFILHSLYILFFVYLYLFVLISLRWIFFSVSCSLCCQLDS